MEKKSLVNHAFDVLSHSKGPTRLHELFNAVIKEAGLELSEEELKTRISRFYTQLSLDGRFIILEDGCWDLRSRHTLEESQADRKFALEEEGEFGDKEEEALDKAERGEVEDDTFVDESDTDFDKVEKNKEEDY